MCSLVNFVEYLFQFLSVSILKLISLLLFAFIILDVQFKFI